MKKLSKKQILMLHTQLIQQTGVKLLKQVKSQSGFVRVTKYDK